MRHLIILSGLLVALSSVAVWSCSNEQTSRPARSEPTPATVSPTPEAPSSASEMSSDPAEQVALSSEGEIDEPSPTVSPPPEEAEEQHQQERIKRILKLAMGTPVECYGLSQEDVLPLDVCQELGFAIENGKTRPNGRVLVKTYLKDLGLRAIRAYLVARVGDRQYEVAKLGYDDYFDISYPTNKHFLLETVSTEFSSAGHFKMWVRQTGTQMIELKNGFTETWNTYQESPLGQLWQEVRDAPSGVNTQTSARSLLLFIVIGKALEIGRGYRPTDKEVMDFISSQ